MRWSHAPSDQQVASVLEGKGFRAGRWIVGFTVIAVLVVGSMPAEASSQTPRSDPTIIRPSPDDEPRGEGGIDLPGGDLTLVVVTAVVIGLSLLTGAGIISTRRRR